MTPSVPRRDRRWAGLARGTKRRWVSAYGGPRSLGAERRAERARLAYEGGASLTPEQRGHGGPYRAVFTQLVTTEGVVENVEVNDRVETHRAAQHANDVGRLLAGEIEPRAFRLRWRRRVRTVGGYKLDWTAGRVTAGIAEAGPAPSPYVVSPSPVKRRKAA